MEFHSEGWSRMAVLLAMVGTAVSPQGWCRHRNPDMRRRARPRGAAYHSPVVANGKVTFRLRAPDARSVNVSGDFGPDVANEPGCRRHLDRDSGAARSPTGTSTSSSSMACA